MENVPIYVKVDKYQELVEIIQGIELKLDGVNKMIDRINQLKAEEDAQLKQWTENLVDMRGRLERINDAFHHK